MTIFEAIVGGIYPYAVDEALILKSCIDVGVDENEEYSASNKEATAKVIIAVLQNLLSLSSESRNNHSMSYDTEKLKERIYNIATFNGLADIAAKYCPLSRISDQTDKW